MGCDHATIVDTVALSHLPSTKNQPGAAALRAAEIKTLKYRSLAPTYQIMPISLETFGAWHTESLDFMRELGRRTSLVTGDQRETTFLLQRISVAVQRGNAAVVRGSLPPSESGKDNVMF